MLTEFDPRRNPRRSEIPIGTTLNTTADNKPVTYKVEVYTRSKSKREILLEGLNIIKGRLTTMTSGGEQAAVEVNGRVMRPAPVGYSHRGNSWVDSLITQWLGAVRDGLTLCWKLRDGYTYKYDIYEHKLTRVLTDG